jgi:hypothetical protein
MHAAALTLGLAVTGAAMADKGKSGSSSSHYHHGSTSSGPTYPGSNGSWSGSSYHKEFVTPYHEYKGPYYKGEHNHFWSSRYWSESYGCYLHWCPRERCYFYWCEPCGCYYPIDYCPTGRYDY